MIRPWWPAAGGSQSYNAPSDEILWALLSNCRIVSGYKSDPNASAGTCNPDRWWMR